MKLPILLSMLACAASCAYGQRHSGEQPSAHLLSEPGSTFQMPDRAVKAPLTVIAYGDMRFTGPSDTTDTNPAVRRFLVEQIARESPDAVFLSGDVPLAGGNESDYAVFGSETVAWRADGLRIYPAIGNHEFRGCSVPDCLGNWWNAFPQLRNRRWYSVALGSRFYAINLDSETSLLPDSQQGLWLEGQLRDLPLTVAFVLISLHHPPVADFQEHIQVSHNPRANEIAVRDFLSSIAPKLHARVIVSAGHIHNYERHVVDDVVYLVSGGGGARPYVVDRTPDDLFQSRLFPNYHYVKFVLNGDRLQGVMYRVRDAESSRLEVEAADHFEIREKARP